MIKSCLFLRHTKCIKNYTKVAILSFMRRKFLPRLL